MSEPHEFTCKDAAGQLHVYTCDLHRGSEGMPIALNLAAMVVEPLAAAAGPAILAKVSSKSGEKLSIKDFDLETLDFGQIGGTLRSVLAQLPPKLIFAVLQYTNRDGQPLVGTGALSPTLHFDEAYKGNYFEIVAAVWEVCTINAFFPGLGSLSTVAKQALSAARKTDERDN